MNKKVYSILMISAISVLASSCYKKWLPGEKPYFSNNCNFSMNEYTVYPDRTNVFYGIFNSDYSTQPMEISLTNMTHADGTPAPELAGQVDVLQWKNYYSGTEKSVDEIEAKRFSVKRPSFDIRATSGDIVFWPSDTTNIKPGTYIFDVLAKNEAGQKTFQKFKLYVKRPRPYEPWYFNDDTGERNTEDVEGKKVPKYQHPSLSNVKDEQNIDIKTTDVRIYYEWKPAAKNTFSIKFYDRDSLPISFGKFNATKWDSIRYYSQSANLNVPFGFNRRFSEDSTVVTYDRTNPYPVLADIQGERAGIELAYERRYSGMRSIGRIGFSFALFKQGSWDIIVKFSKTPRFEND